MRVVTPILSAIGMAVILGAFGQALDDFDTGTAMQREAQKTAQEEARFVKAVREICGPNAGFVLTDIPGQIQCATHRGLIRATKGML